MDKAKAFAAAEKHFLKGQNDKALQLLESILRVDPNDLKALNRAADIYLKTDEIEKATAYLKRIGIVYTKDGFYSKAVAVYKRILKLDQKSTKAALIEIHEQLAGLYGQLGLVSEAMGHYAIIVDFYDQVGDQVELLNVLKKVSDLDPYNVDSQLKLAELFLTQNQADSADEALQRLDENLRTRANWPEIVRLYERWVDLFPDKIERLKELVNICLKANEPKKALARIQVAFRGNPRNPEVLELLSATFFNLKQPEKARAVDFELVKIYRHSGQAELLADVEARIANKNAGGGVRVAAASIPTSPSTGVDVVDPADELLQRMELSPPEKKVISECDVYFKYGLSEKAHEVLSKQLAQFPESIPLRWKLKRSAQELGKKEEVIQLLSEVLLLAKTKNQQSWIQIAAAELQRLDSSHSALVGIVPAAESAGKSRPSQETAVSVPESKKMSQAAPVPLQDAPNLDDSISEISIVVDEVSIEESAVSDISFMRSSRDNRKPSNDISSPIELEEENDSDENAISGTNIEKSLDLESPEPILSESDFSSSELESLQKSLDPEATRRSNAEDLKMADPEVDEVEENSSSMVLELNMEEVESSPSSSTEAIEMLEISTDSEESEVSSETSEFEIRQGLEEAAFFKSQGLKEEAEGVIRSLKQKYPQHKDWSLPAAESAQKKVDYPAAPSVASKSKDFNEDAALKKKVAEVSGLGTKMKLAVQEDDREEGEEDFFDFAGELNKEMNAVPLAKGQVPVEVKDVFSAFKAGVAQAVREDDWETHFDLGIAYREMGLIDDAINEFTLVSKVQGRKPSALHQIAITEMARQNWKVAKEYLDEALKSPKMTPEEKMSFCFDLAEVLLELNDPRGAKKMFSEVQLLDPDFREVTERLKKMA